MLVRVAGRLRRMTNKRILASVGGDQRPVFHDAAKTYPSLLKIDENFDVIREELMKVLPKTDRMPRYHEVDAYQQEISGADERAWRVLYLVMPLAGDEFPNRKLCPRTAVILDGIPGLSQAFFSILEPRKTVPAHKGPSPQKLRYHTAFKVPKKSPPTMRVRDQYYTWQEGKSLFFDDSWEHEVFNESDETRVVLIVDVERPVPLHLHLLNRLHFKLLAASIGKDDWSPFYEHVGLRTENEKPGEAEQREKVPF